MKKLFSFLLIAVFATSVAFADDEYAAPRWWTEPAIFEYDQAVTFYYDFKGLGVEADESLAIWGWQPKQTPGAYGNAAGETVADIDQGSIFTYVGDYVWKFTIVPTDFYGATKEEFMANGEDGFWQRIRVFGADGIYKGNTGVLAPLFPHKVLLSMKAQSLGATTPVEWKVYPNAINATTSVAFILNNDEVGFDLSATTAHLVYGINGWVYKSDYYAWKDEDMKLMTNYFGYDDIFVCNVTFTKDPELGIDAGQPESTPAFAWDTEITDIQFLFTTRNWANGTILETEFENDYARPWQGESGGTGINKVTTSSKSIEAYISDNVLTVNVPSFEVYTISGIRIAKSNNSTLNIAGLSQGIYIVKTALGSAKVVK